jgi:hypothetical protein
LHVDAKECGDETDADDVFCCPVAVEIRLYDCGTVAKAASLKIPREIWIGLGVLK